MLPNYTRSLIWRRVDNRCRRMFQYIAAVLSVASMIKIRRPHHRLIFIMRNPHIWKDGRYIILLDKWQMNWLEFNLGFNFKLQHRSTDCKTHRLPLVRHWTGSVSVQVMACRLFGAKPSPEPMLVYCQLDSWQQMSVKFESEFYHFHWWKCIWNCRLPILRPLCPGEMS